MQCAGVGDIGFPEETVLAQRSLSFANVFRVVVERKSSSEGVYGLRDCEDVANFLKRLLE